MFDHVTIRVTDRAASEDFYNSVLRTLGIDESYRTNTFSLWNEFMITGATPEHPVTRNLHIGFAAPSREQVDAFWRVGTGAGYRDDGPPGLRPQYSEDYYGAFLRDPDGNSAEAVHDRDAARRGAIDHLWIRVADLAEAKAFYETIAPHAGLRLGDDTPERVQFAGEGLLVAVTLDDPADAATRDLVVGAVERAAWEVEPDEAAFAIDVTFPGERPPDRIDEQIAAVATPFYRRGAGVS